VLLGLCSLSWCCQNLAVLLLYDLIYHLLSLPSGTSSFSESVMKILQYRATISKEVLLSSEPDTLIIYFILLWGNGNISLFMLFPALIHTLSVKKWGQTENTCNITCKCLQNNKRPITSMALHHKQENHKKYIFLGNNIISRLGLLINFIKMMQCCSLDNN